MTNIKSIKQIGKHQTYDIEVDHEDHQFYLANGMLTSNSHATAYAIDSYMTAYLLTHHREEWLCAYLESMSGSDASRSKAFSEVRSMGYEIVPIDVKYATRFWRVLPGNKLMPSLLSSKRIGLSAVKELEELQPFETFEELCWNNDEYGSWRLKKVNKGALEALVKIEAFNSLDCVGPDKLFSNYAHMHKVVIENLGLIKKSSKKRPNEGKDNFYRLIEEFADTPEWTKDEKINNMIKYFGTIDVNSVVSKKLIDKFENKGYHSIDNYNGRNLYWFCISDTIPRKTKNGKDYLLAKVIGPSAKEYRLFIWGYDNITTFEKYSICIAEISKNDFGFATSLRKLRKFNV